MNSKNNLAITNARIVTPLGHEAVRGRAMRHLNIIEHGRVEVKDGIISYVGPDEQSTSEKSSKDSRPQSTNMVRTINAQGHCLLPGFVDSHTHFVFGGLRAEEFSWRLRGESYMSIMQRGGGIVNTVNATRALSAEEMKNRALRLVNRMAMMGVTTVEGKSGYGLDFDTELRQLEVMRQLTNDPNRLVDVVPTFLGAHAVPEEYKGRTDYYVDFLIDKLLPCVSSRKLAEFCDVFCEEGVFSIDQSRRLLIAAQAQGLALKIHADEIVSTGGAELAAE